MRTIVRQTNFQPDSLTVSYAQINIQQNLTRHRLFKQHLVLVQTQHKATELDFFTAQFFNLCNGEINEVQIFIERQFARNSQLTTLEVGADYYAGAAQELIGFLAGDTPSVSVESMFASLDATERMVNAWREAGRG